jgi:hypothetical protein
MRERVIQGAVVSRRILLRVSGHFASPRSIRRGTRLSVAMIPDDSLHAHIPIGDGFYGRRRTHDSRSSLRCGQRHGNRRGELMPRWCVPEPTPKVAT